MKTYTTIKFNGIPFHYSIAGNRYGWTMRVINNSMLSPQLWATAGKEVKYPFWEQPKDKKERKEFYKKQALELVKKYLT